jgi:hypothetical protein
MNANGKETWHPQKLSAQWGEAHIVASKFKVTLGGMDPVESPAAVMKTSAKTALFQVKEVTEEIGSTEEKVISGNPDRDYGIHHPGDSGTNAILLPDTNYTNARFVAYFGTVVGTGSTTGTAMIDFAGAANTPTLATATVQQIQDHILDENNDALADIILAPDANPDSNNWPEYVGIASAITGTISGSLPVLHAFVHTEDEDSTNTSKYMRICYARSHGNNSSFGKSFTKMSSTAGAPIITHPTPEHGITEEPGWLYGCGSPSVFEWGNYYYLIHETRVLRGPINVAYKAEPGISIARAYKTSVNSNYYSIDGNPWYKYKQVTSTYLDAANWTEPGIGGMYSILINAVTDELAGYRTDTLKISMLGEHIQRSVIMNTLRYHTQKKIRLS